MHHDVRFNDLEQRALKQFAEWYDANTPNTSMSEIMEVLGIDEATCKTLMRRMKDHGVARIVTMGGDVEIDSYSVDMWHMCQRAIREEQDKPPPDHVEKLQQSVRSYPVAAWLLIGFLALTALVTFINQLTQIFERFGWIPKLACLMIVLRRF